MIIPLSTSAREAVPEAGLRKSISFQNVDSAIAIYLKKERPGQTTVTSSVYDFLLPPQFTVGFDVEQDGKEVVNARWTAIAASGTPNLSIVENEILRR